MSWTNVKTWAVGDPMAAADLNTYLRDNLNFLASSFGGMQPTWTQHGFGTGAAGATGAFASIGDFGDPTSAYYRAAGSGTNIGLVVQAKGTAGVTLAGGSGNGGVRVGDVSGAAGVGFYGTGPQAKPTVTGSRGANAALTSLLTALAALGLLVDSST